MLFSVRRFFSRITIRHKLMLVFAAFFIGMSITVLVLFFHISRIYTQNFSRMQDTNMQQLRTNFRNKLEEWGNSLDVLVNNRAFRNYMQSDFADDYTAYVKYTEDIEPFILSIKRGVQIDDIRVYSGNRTTRITSVTNNAIGELENLVWFDSDQSAPVGYNWSLASRGGHREKPVICCYLVWQGSGGQDNLVYSIFIDPAKLYGLLAAESAAGNLVVLTDENGAVVTSSRTNLTGSPVETLLGESQNAVPGEGRVFLDGQGYRMKISDISSNQYTLHGWRLYYLTPESTLHREIAAVGVLAGLLFAACFGLSVCMLLMVSNNLTARIGTLIAELARVQTGEFGAQIIISGNDEISILEQSFNNTSRRLGSLVDELVEANSRISQAQYHNQQLLNINREAQILSLQYQMNPHYLFNTLEMIRMELVREENRSLASLVRAFSDNVRAALYTNEGMYTLGDELRLVENFIHIQKARHEDRIHFFMDVEPGLQECRLPVLCIQPLMENAVLHGAEPSVRPCEVRLTVMKKRGTLRMTVSDNGVGMDKSALDKLKAVIYSDEETARRLQGVRCSALRNAHSRIQLIYGPSYGLKISSKKGEYTKTTLILKYETGGELADMRHTRRLIKE